MPGRGRRLPLHACASRLRQALACGARTPGTLAEPPHPPLPPPPHTRTLQVGRYIQSRGGTVAAEELAPFLDLQPGQLASDRGRITGGWRCVSPLSVGDAVLAIPGCRCQLPGGPCSCAVPAGASCLAIPAPPSSLVLPPLPSPPAFS